MARIAFEKSVKIGLIIQTSLNSSSLGKSPKHIAIAVNIYTSEIIIADSLTAFVNVLVFSTSFE